MSSGGRSSTPSTAIVPPQSEVLKAAEIINAGARVTFLVGHGANGAPEEVLRILGTSPTRDLDRLRQEPKIIGDDVEPFRVA